MTQQVSAAYGEGRYEVYGTALRCGTDLTVAFVGGTLPHVGAVSLGVYEAARDSATVSTITAFGHRDDVLAAQAAKQLAVAVKGTVSVSVGIHLDTASAEDIELLCKNFQLCLRALMQLL